VFSKLAKYLIISVFLAFIPLSVDAQIAEVRVGITEFDERSLNLSLSTQRANENSVAINGEILFEEPNFL